MATSLVEVSWLISLILAQHGAAAIRDVQKTGKDMDRYDLNERPIVGILSQPGEPAAAGQSYIAASYVKWVESAGARVIPIFYDLSDDEIRHRFSIVNAVLLPGGGADLSPGHRFYDVAALLVDLAIEANDKGDYFPVHGTCLGLETLSIIISKNYTILGNYDAEDAPAALMYTAAAQSSYLLKSLPKDVVKALQNSPIAMENHMKGLSMNAFQENKPLAEFFNVLSLSLDKAGSSYVSTLEAKQYPITATQWHPEKNSFEWNDQMHFPHSTEAIRMSQEIGNFFIAEARRNQHKASSVIEEDDLLIYNWQAVFTGRHAGSGKEEHDFEQAYVFSVPL